MTFQAPRHPARFRWILDVCRWIALGRLIFPMALDCRGRGRGRGRIWVVV